MTILRKHLLWIFLALVAVFVCVFLIGRAANRWLEDANREMVQSKLVYPSEATVIRKENFRCDKEPCVYIDGYGDRIEMKQGETQNRVYYQIDDFNVPEPRRSRAQQQEKDRVRKFSSRFTCPENWYDQVEPGTKIYVHHKCFSDGTIQVWGVDRDPR